MKEEKKTRGQLISELAKQRHRIAELEKKEAGLKLKEQALRKSKELFEKTFVSQLDALFILDADIPPKIVDCNPSTTKIFGHSRKEMLGRTTDFLHVDKTRRREFREHLYPAITKQGFFHLPEFSMKRKDGTVFPTEHTVVALKEEQDKRIGWVSVVRDISERKRAEKALAESEQRYSSLFKNNHSVMLLIDPENADIVDANPAACSFYSWSHEELTRMKITDINMLSNEQVFQEIERAKSEKRNHFFFRHRLASEEIRDVEVYSGPIRLHGKELLYSIIHDITERKRAVAELRKAHDGLEQQTAELEKLNEKLRKREAELEIQTIELEEVNTALRVLLKRRNEDKIESEEKTLSNVKQLVLPYIARLKSSGLDDNQVTYVNILESNLNDIVSPFSRRLSSTYLGLTPTEIQIANLVKEGKTTKEIAKALHSSPRTVEFHRNKIREKIGIKNSKVNLRSYLLSM
ncbi:MAG: PAS domain S-box protein [Syntrophobacterales bacterium]|jgi:PAS domain S-box-containing protein